MDDWEKFNEKSLPEKEDFYSHLNMEHVTDADYAHSKTDFKHFKIKNLGEYQVLSAPSDTLLLVRSCKICFSSCISIVSSFTNTKVKLDLLTDIDMLLMVKKSIGGGIYHSIYRHAKANNKYMKDYDKNKELPYLQYWDVNKTYGWTMSQKLPGNNFEWIKDTSKFNEDFLKTLMEKVMKNIFLKLMFNILKNCINFIIIYHFCKKKIKLKKWKSL